MSASSVNVLQTSGSEFSGKMGLNVNMSSRSVFISNACDANAVNLVASLLELMFVSAVNLY